MPTPLPAPDTPPADRHPVREADGSIVVPYSMGYDEALGLHYDAGPVRYLPGEPGWDALDAQLRAIEAAGP
jgi:hypothetical protein